MNLKDFIRSIPDYPKKKVFYLEISQHSLKMRKLFQKQLIKLLKDQKK